MVKSKLRHEDERCSEIVSMFLDKHFYKIIFDKPEFQIERIYDKKRQIEGFDVIIIDTINNEFYGIDEKAAIRYVNKQLNTFSMELSFIDRSGNIHDGWLFDETKKNNYFLFVWIDKATNDILKSELDIQEVEIALVKREKIIKYLEELGWTKDKINIKSEKIRSSEKEYGGNIHKYGCKFTCSRYLIEQPVNILISRKNLIELSTKNLKINHYGK